MRLRRARVRKYRSIKDTGWFEVEPAKTILVGPNEAGKTALLRALEQLNAAPDVKGFVALRDYPRSELNDINRKAVEPKDVVVVAGEFVLDDEDRAVVRAIAPEFEGCGYRYEKHLDNSYSQVLTDAPSSPTYGELKPDLLRLAAHGDGRAPKPPEGTEAPLTHAAQLTTISLKWTDTTPVIGDVSTALTKWLDGVLPLVDEGDATELGRYSKLTKQVAIGPTRAKVAAALKARLPVFVYFSSYFRVRPLIHLDHLATRIEQNLLDDELYDFGNLCLLKFVGFTARELSNLGKAAEPAAGNAEAFERYRSQLDDRSYKLNAASVRLTQEITRVWDPNLEAGTRKFTVRMNADQQYLKVVVEDELGAEIELDQRSEGFQWLVSFFTVFFAQSTDKYKNAILLLDEPGMSLHGLKQRDFRTTISRLAKDNQILFTTHSPFMVGPDELDQVRVVELADRTAGTKVHTSITAEDSAAVLVLQEALGYDLAQSLFAQQRNLLLEGLTDYWYVEATTDLLRAAGLADLNQKIALLPASSAGKVVYFATILHAHHLKVAALLDSDSAGEQAASQDTLVHTLGNKGILRTKDAYKGQVAHPEIEDLLRGTLLTVARDDLHTDATALAKAQPARGIVDLLAEVGGQSFSKYHLAKAFVRWTRDHSASDLLDDERVSWSKLVDLVNKALK